MLVKENNQSIEKDYMGDYYRKNYLSKNRNNISR